MYRIKNTADDRMKHLQHRTATKFELEPSLGGYRIRLGSHYDISDEHYARVKPVIDEWVKKGMVDTIKLGSSESMDIGPRFNEKGLQLGGPTLEEWKAAGYDADNYPPNGYAEVFSPGLVALQRAREELAQRAAEVIKEALSLPTVTEQLLPAMLVEEPPAIPPAPEEPPVSEPAPGPVPVPAVASTNMNKGNKKKLI